MKSSPVSRHALAWVIALIFIAISASAMPPVKWNFKGFNYASWWIGDYTTAQSKAQLDALKTTHATWAALVTTWYMDNLTDSTIESNTSRSQPYDELKGCVDDMHFRGLKVMLKPHVDCLDGAFRGDITPAVPATWFQTYRRYMTNMARLCQQKNVEMFCIGTELDSMAVAAYSNDWKALIQAITNIYTGPIVYTANHPEAGARLVPFWRYMDYASVDAYYMLDSAAPVIPVSQLVNDWQNCNASGFVGRNWVNEVTTWQAWHGKPVIFAEVGYSSREYAAREPWMNGGVYNGTAQSNCYEAMFEVWQSFPWFKGAFIWSWFPVNTGGVGDADHTPQGKPGYHAVQKWFTNTGVSNTYVTVSNTWANPVIVTNNLSRVVQFFVKAGTTGTAVTNVGIYLVNVGGPAGKVKMTNIGGSTWRFAFTIPAGQTQDEKEVFVVAEDNNGSVSSSRTVVIVVNQQWFYTPNWVLYDAGDTNPDTDVLMDWSWGSPGFADVTNAPKFGAKRGLLVFSNTPAGIAQLRDPSWAGIDCSGAERLELWIKGSAKLPSEQGLRLHLYSVGSKYSAATNLYLTTNFRKFDVSVSFLTNQAAGADAGFSMKRLLGIEFLNAPVAPTGVKIFVDNVLVAARVTVFNPLASPPTPDNSKATNVQFTCQARSAIANISSVTLDLTLLGGAKVRMTNLAGMTSFRFTRLLPKDFAPGSYALPVTAYDASGNTGRAEIIMTVKGPVPKIIEKVYDGESADADVNWEQWWGGISAVDVTGGQVLNGLQSMQVTVISNWSGGVQVALPGNWTGVDVTAADKFQFYYKSTAVLILQLFSYDPINGVQYSRAVNLSSSAGYRYFSTNLSYYTNGLFNPKKFVGAQISSTGGTGTAFFDDMYFTAMVEIRDARAVPSIVTNTKKNVVQFWATVKSGNSSGTNNAVTNCYINLKTLGGPTNAKMTNISGRTLFRYTFTIASNWNIGSYVLPVRGFDNKGFVGRGSSSLQIVGKSPYAVVVVYDGDTVAANPVQWFPAPPPNTAFFFDVDGTVTPPHSGLLSGVFRDTNASAGQMFHDTDPSYNGFDITGAAKLEIWAKGQSGGEKVRIMPVFSDYSRVSFMGNPIDITLTQNWGQWLIDMSLITNGTSAPFVSRFVGVYFEYQAPFVKGSTVYFDDVKFVNYLLIRDQLAVPERLDNEQDTAMTFTCKAFTMNQRVTNVTLDLAPLGGAVVKMTNISGAAWTNFRYSYTYQSNTNVRAGLKRLKVVARDNLGYTRIAYINVYVISKKMVVLWDYEDATAQDWKWYDSAVNNNTYYLIWTNGVRTISPDPMCPGFNAGITNAEYDAATGYLPPYHGTYCVGWSLNTTPKWWHGGGSDTAVDWANHDYGGVYHAFTYGVRGECTIASSPDFSAPPGYMMFVLAEPSANLDDEDPFVTTLHQEGPSWSDGATGFNNRLIPGKWTKTFMDFSECVDEGPDGRIVVLPADRVNCLELGFRLSGAYSCSGPVKIYIDYVVSMDDVAPGAPTGLTVANPGTGGRLQLNWVKNGEADVERYKIYQSTNSISANAIWVGTVTTNYFEDRGAWNGKTFYYWVSAVDLSENEGPKSAMAAGSATGAMPNVVYPYKGVTLLSVTPGEFLNNSVHSVLTNIRDTGANIVSIPVTWFMAASNSSTVASNAASTIPDADLRHIMKDITNLKMNVMLVPKIDVASGVPIYRVSPANTNTWFASYQTMIVKYATIASQASCALYSVGSRLHSLTTSAYDAKWTGIVNAVKQKFKNPLTYSAMWGAPQKHPTFTERPTYRNLCVWDKVDFIGIDAYFSLSYTVTPPLSELLTAWNSYTITNDIPYRSLNLNRLFYDWFGDMKKWQETRYPGKGIIFTEVGYASRDKNADEPWKENIGANNNLAQQNAYEAVFRRIWDQGFIRGTFWNHFKATPVATPNTLLAMQGKPAYNVVKEWYSIKPHHFAIFHDGGGESGVWERVVIAAHQVDDSPVPVFNGSITLDIDQGTAAAISWTNLTPCGNLVDWGAGTAKAVFTFNGACGGVVTLGIKDNSMETVNISVKYGYALEGTGVEDENLVFTGPLSHFVISHDGWAIRNLPETISVQAVDVFGNLKVDYKGTISLFAAGSVGGLKWKLIGSTNSSFKTNAGRVRFTFNAADAGMFSFQFTDNTVESVDIEAVTTNRNYQDNDVSDPLHVIDLDHFAVYHDGSALLNFPEKVVIAAEDAFGSPVYGVSGNVTISLATNVTGGPKGAFGMSLRGGKGTFSALGGYRWLYTMVPQDAGVVTLSVIDSALDTVDIEATEGIHHDNDVPPQYLVFMSHKYHFVSRKNPTPEAPYARPDTAATNILMAWTNTSANDVVLIIDNDTYPSVLMNANIKFYHYRTIAGAATNMPTIVGNGVNPIGVVCGFNSPMENLTFKNLKLVAINSPVYTICQIGIVGTNYFVNCVLTNTGAFPLLSLDLNGGPPISAFGSTFLGQPGQPAQTGGRTPANYRGCRIFNSDYVLNNSDDYYFYGNIVSRLRGGTALSGLANNAAGGNCLGAEYNTFYKGASCGVAGRTINLAWNNIVLSNTSIGIVGAAGTHQYNDAFGNGTDFQNLPLGTGDLTADPAFVNSSGRDFRLKAASPGYNIAEPNAAVRACPGGLSMGVRPREASVSAVTVYTLSFVPLFNLPKTVNIKLTFPAGCDISSVTQAVTTSSWGGTFTPFVQGNVLLLKKNNDGIAAPALTSQNIIVKDVKNPSLGGQYSLTWETKEGDATKLEGDTLDYPRPSNCFDIVASDLKLVKHFPGINQAGLPLTTSVTCTFNTNLIPATVTTDSLLLQDSGWKKVPAAYTFINGGKTAVITASSGLQANEFYSVTVTAGVQNVLGGNVTKETQFHFRTAAGSRTPHEYDTIAINANLSDWKTNNIVESNAGQVAVELVANDTGDAVWGHTKQMWVTWNTNNLYIALKKPVMSGLEWWDYVAIDTTRDQSGASTGPAGLHPFVFENNRKPEYLLMFDHNNIGPVWDAWTNYSWTGAVWQAAGLIASNHSQDNGGLIEIRIPWTTFGGAIPNRISLAAFVYTNRACYCLPVYDTSPESVKGPTNWVTVDPDNDGNEIPDYVFVQRMDHFKLWHDGSADVNVWEPFEIRAIDNLAGVNSNYSGQITIDLTMGSPATVKFTNYSGAGTLTSLPNGRAVYQWLASDKGIVSLRVKDTAADCVNIRIRSVTGGYMDDNTEGSLCFNPAAVLFMMKSGTPATVVVGDTITYRIDITNQSAWYSYDVRVVDPIPYGTVYLPNSLRQGPKTSAYATATNVTDGLNDDEGSFDGSRVVFCGPQAGSAPTTSGALAGNSTWAVYFQVKVKGTNVAVVPRVLSITNKDGTFDGYCVNDGTAVSGGLLAAGDSTPPWVATNLYQFANDRDHYFSYDPDNIGYQGYLDGATFQVGNANIGGAGGEDNYHSYLTFGLWSVPANGMITSATLFIRQTAAAGAGLDNPIHVDHVDYQNTFGNAPLDAARFNCTAPRSVLDANYFSFNGLAAIGWVRIPSTSQVQFAAANLKSFAENGDNRVFQVMLRDNNEGMGAANGLATFSAQNDATPANRPYLRVWYSLPGKQVRGYTGFDLSVISNGNITSATMFVYQTNVTGTAAVISPVVVDNVDYGNTFEAADYGAGVLQANVANFAAASPGWIGLAVKSAVSNAWTNKKVWTKNASQRWLQVRFRPTGMDTNNLVADQQLLGSAETAKKAWLKAYFPMTYLAAPPLQVTNVAVLNMIVRSNWVVVSGANMTTISVSKTVTNITLKGNPSPPVPGATFWYRIVCSNKTMTAGDDVVIFDKIDAGAAAFLTNSAVTPALWTVEYSTNAAPVQLFTSPNYAAVQPPYAKVKWIRWKRASWPGLSTDTFRYRVIVK